MNLASVEGGFNACAHVIFFSLKCEEPYCHKHNETEVGSLPQCGPAMLPHKVALQTPIPDFSQAEAAQSPSWNLPVAQGPECAHRCFPSQ